MNRKLPDRRSPGRLAATPRPASRPPLPSGKYPIAAGRALLQVPSALAVPAPLIVFFHGAGSGCDQAVRLIGRQAAGLGALLLATKSFGPTWDAIRGAFGADVATLDDALGETFERFDIDYNRLTLAGFSDGATYSLSLGLLNGDLFRRLVAFSPGFIVPGSDSPVGRPQIFISHGVRDDILPIDKTSRILVPSLRAAGYDVAYREFGGGHEVPPDQVQAALANLAHG